MHGDQKLGVSLPRKQCSVSGTRRWGLTSSVDVRAPRLSWRGQGCSERPWLSRWSQRALDWGRHTTTAIKNGLVSFVNCCSKCQTWMMNILLVYVTNNTKMDITQLASSCCSHCGMSNLSWDVHYNDSRLRHNKTSAWHYMTSTWHYTKYTTMEQCDCFIMFLWTFEMNVQMLDGWYNSMFLFALPQLLPHFFYLSKYSVQTFDF